MKSFPWDAIVEGFDEKTGFPIYDRQYDAKDFRDVMSRFFSNGIFADEPLGFAVKAGTGMTVTVEGGTCFIDGTTGIETDTQTLIVPDADKTNPRIDTVVLRWDANLDERSIDLYVITGTPAKTPVRPALTRVKDYIWELGICDILVPAGSVSVAGTRITDTRLETARCGIVAPFAEFDTTSFYTFLTNKVNSLADEVEKDSLQYLEDTKSDIDKKFNDAYKDTEDKIKNGASQLASMRDELQKQTDTAVNLAKSALDGTTAGHLQNEIDNINDYTTGINLLKGTRDFKNGTQKFLGTAAYCYDGWGNDASNYYEYIKENSGFTELWGHNPSSLATVRSNIITLENVNAGDVITFAADIIPNEHFLEAAPSLFGIIEKTENSTTNTSTTFVNRNIIADVYGNEPLQAGKWQTVVMRYKIKNNNCKYIYLSCALGYQALDAIRKPLAYLGDINKPIWSPSPFDIDYINDETTGINLLRGTRNFVLDTGNVNKNGFYKRDSYVFVKDESGYINAHYDDSIGPTAANTGQALYGSYIPNVYGDSKEVTFSFDIKIDSDIETALPNITIGFETLDSNNSRVKLVSSTANLLVGHSFVQGEWSRISYRVIVNLVKVANFRPYFSVTKNKNTSVTFRKPKVEEGIINNPIWSASPFDVAQQSDYEALLKRVEALESK